MIGTQIKLARIERQMSQSSLGRLLKSNQGNVSRWELNKVSPEIQTLTKLMVILRKPMDYFLEKGGTEEPTFHSFNDKHVDTKDVNSLRIPILTHVPNGSVYTTNGIEGYLFIPRFMYPGAKYAIHCLTDEMTPEIKKGELCIIRAESRVINKKIMLVRIPGKGYCIKKVKKNKRHIEFHSINPKYKILTPKSFKIVGQVIGVWKRYE